jgi:hypothetical protein
MIKIKKLFHLKHWLNCFLSDIYASIAYSILCAQAALTSNSRVMGLKNEAFLWLSAATHAQSATEVSSSLLAGQSATLERPRLFRARHVAGT